MPVANKNPVAYVCNLKFKKKSLFGNDTKCHST